MTAVREVSELYECRTCGGLAATAGLLCPYCQANSGGTTTYASLGDGDTEKVELPWYRTIRLNGGDRDGQ